MVVGGGNGAPRVPFPSIAFRQNICCVAWWAEVLSSWHFPNLNRSPCRDVTLPETLLWGTFPFRQNIFHEARQAGSGGRKCFPRGNLPFWQNIFHEARQAVSGERRCLLVVIFLPAKHLPRRHLLWVRGRQVAGAGVPNLGTSASSGCFSSAWRACLCGGCFAGNRCPVQL